MTNLHPDPTSETPKSRAWLPIALCALLCGIAFGAGLFVSKLLVSKTDGYPVVAEWFGTTDEGTLVAPSQIDEEAQEETLAVVAPGFSLGEDGAPLITLTIDWIDPALQPTTAFETTLYQALCFGSSSWKDSSDQAMNLCGSPVPDAIAYRLGTVVGGVYDGRYLEMATVSQPGMGLYFESYYLLRDSSGTSPVVLLDRHARTTGDWLPSTSAYRASEMLGWNERLKLLTGYLVDSQSVIPELETFDSELTDTQGNRYLFTGYWVRFDSSYATALSKTSRFASLDNGRPRLELYEPSQEERTKGATAVGTNQFYLVDEDGRVLWYDLVVPFFEYEQTDGSSTVTSGLPRIRWNDGTTHTEGYYLKGAMGGCGFSQVTRVLTQEDFAELPAMLNVGVGLTQDGSAPIIFEPSTYEHEYYKESAFNAITMPAYGENGEELSSGKSYADFAHPYLYFQDAFNRWIELSSKEIIPPVECGKPVIYLYPETPTDLTVEVAPRGGFSYTEPVYRDGWRVRAYPDGRIVNREDGREYPYLFWEGRGGVYAPPTSYWVVERARVEPFLRETLASMNLIEPEIADFLEFWLPRMQTAPFYKIGFHDTRVMDELAPLSLSVKPDHTFRLLMDYEPFDHWAPSRPPFYLPRANRTGFEVIEWGGVLR